MSILPRLYELYRSVGYEPMTGYNPHHFNNYRDAPFTVFLGDNHLMGVAGLALQEVMMLEPLGGLLAPQRILVIGNARGWSTLTLSLIFPAAKVLAIDPDQDGNAFTNDLIGRGGLNAIAATGASPHDVAPLCREHLGGPADLVLIDALHTNAAVLADFAACRPQGHDGTVYFFHDLINWNLTEAFQRIRAESGLEGAVLTRTPSGMGVAWKTAPQAFKDYIAVFFEHAHMFHAYRRFVLDPVASALEQL